MRTCSCSSWSGLGASPLGEGNVALWEVDKAVGSLLPKKENAEERRALRKEPHKREIRWQGEGSCGGVPFNKAKVC